MFSTAFLGGPDGEGNFIKELKFVIYKSFFPSKKNKVYIDLMFALCFFFSFPVIDPYGADPHDTDPHGFPPSSDPNGIHVFTRLQAYVIHNKLD